jgi:TonB family protein
LQSDESPSPSPKQSKHPAADGSQSPEESAARTEAIAAAINASGSSPKSSDGAGRETGSGGHGTASSGAGSGNGGAAGAASEIGWYNDMIQDRFHEQWDQPTVASGTAAGTLVALLKIRVEKDGRISHYSLMSPSGVPAMDDSVLAAAARVKQIDALPDKLAKRGYYEIAIKFERD